MKESGNYMIRGAVLLAGTYFVLDVVSLVLVWLPSGGALCYRFLHAATDPVVSAFVGGLNVGWVKFFLYELLTIGLYSIVGGIGGWILSKIRIMAKA